MGDIAVFTCLGLLFFLILLIKNKVKEKELQEKARVQEEEKEMKPISSPPVRSPRKKAEVIRARSIAPSYEVHRKKRTSFLLQGWGGKASIKRAFVLSEILKRKDEF